MICPQGFLDTQKGLAHFDLRPNHLHERRSILRHQVRQRRHVDPKDPFGPVARRRAVSFPFLFLYLYCSRMGLDLLVFFHSLFFPLRYECQVSSEPKISKAVRLKVVGK